jgi:RNA-directed DNA polymerase
MSVEQQQGGDYQRTFDFEGLEEAPCPGQNGEDRIQPVRSEERQSLTALTPARALTASLMEEVTNRENLNRAYRRVLANLLLDDLDQELEHRGHKFCRYADDCNIYVRSQAAGERVLSTVTQFLEGRLRLRVNQAKSAVAPAQERKFLGHRLLPDGTLTIAPKSLERARDRLRKITGRNRGISLEQQIQELNSFLTGWVTYFRHAKARSLLAELGKWVRRKLRCVRLKQRKRAKSIADSLHGLGVPWKRCWTTAASGKAWWRMAHTPAAQQGMSNAWFQSQGLVDPLERYLQLQH